MSEAPKTIWFTKVGKNIVPNSEKRLPNDIEYTLTSYVAARLKAADEALQWYAAQVADCRKHGRDGDIARAKLDRDGGYMARQALGHDAPQASPAQIGDE